MRIRDRAGYLARNFLSKVWCYGNKKLKKKLEELELAEMRLRSIIPKKKESIITEAWKRIKKKGDSPRRNKI